MVWSRESDRPRWTAPTFQHAQPARARTPGGGVPKAVEQPEAWRVLGEVAMGCIPAVRRLVLDELVKAEGPMTTSTMADSLDYPTTTVRRTLEDLTAHGLARRHGHGKTEHQFVLL